VRKIVRVLFHHLAFRDNVLDIIVQNFSQAHALLGVFGDPVAICLNCGAECGQVNGEHFGYFSSGLQSPSFQSYQGAIPGELSNFLYLHSIVY
jgi:hypothetical protein